MIFITTSQPGKEAIMTKSYEPSRRILDSNVAGFSHWDGYLVLSQIKPGSKLKLRPEFDNPYDPDAVAVYFHGTKIGYVPRASNFVIAQLIRFGHNGALEARVTSVNPLVHPEEQVQMTIMVTDAR
jgi:hypothetical protein